MDFTTTIDLKDTRILNSSILNNCEIIRNLIDNANGDNDEDYIIEIPFRGEILNDILTEHFTETNYIEIIELLDFLMIDNKRYENIIDYMVDIVEILNLKDLYYKKSVFTDPEELLIACQLWMKNDKEAFIKYGYINYWDVSNITSMKGIFRDYRWDEIIKFKNTFEEIIKKLQYIDNNKIKFNKSFDISNWDVCNVIDMSEMFYNCMFNEGFDISGWNVSNVNKTNCMFSKCIFNKSFDISNWNITIQKGYNIYGMFFGCKLNDSFNISKWDLKHILETYILTMFESCIINESMDFTKLQIDKETFYILNTHRT